MKKWILWTLIVVFAGIFVFSGIYLWNYFSASKEASDAYDSLAQIMEDARQDRPRPERPGQVTEEESLPSGEQTQSTEEAPEESTPTEPTAPSLIQMRNPETGEVVELMPEYAELFDMNCHLVGWIEIPGTRINYPVLQTPYQKDYYLKKNFYRSYSDYGAIYVKEDCNVFLPSDNLTIYGHRMNDGSMFADLHKYKDKSFFQSNRYIYFDTLTEYHTYEILSVFLISSTVTNDFQYHTMVNAQNRDEFDEFVNQCKFLSLYDTGVEAEFGDKLITLSTCEYSNYNGRLVVVAKQIS